MFGLAQVCDGLVGETKVCAHEFGRRECEPLNIRSAQREEHDCNSFLLYLGEAYILETVCDVRSERDGKSIANGIRYSPELKISR